MSEPLILSASSVGTFLRCGYQWYAAYVLRIKSPPSVKQVLGIAAHDAVELNYRQKVETHLDLPVTEVIDSFSDSYDRQVIDVDDPDEDPGKAKDSGVGLVRLYHTEVAPPIQPEYVEQEVKFAIDGQAWSGYIDLATTDKAIRDTKTTGRTPSDTTQYSIAMTGYALGYRHMTGAKEADVVLDFLIRTKTPKYLPVSSGGPINDAAIATFADVVHDVALSIEAGRFLPNGLYSQACAWCGFTKICPALKASRSFALGTTSERD